LQHNKKKSVFKITTRLKIDSQHSEKELLVLCKKGDSKAQFEIYKQYFKAMYNTCLRIVNNKTDAEDVMQEAFLAAFNKIETFREEVAFGG